MDAEAGPPATSTAYDYFNAGTSTHGFRKKRPAPGEQRGPLVLKPLVRDSDERILKNIFRRLAFLADAFEFIRFLVVHELAGFLVAFGPLFLAFDFGFELRALLDRAVPVAIACR
jgi:hypothetical protein